MSDRTIPPNKTKAGAIHNDPWGDRGNQGPPDLDEAIKKLQGQLSGLFGGGSSGDGGSGGGFLKGLSTLGFFGVFAAVAAAYVVFGIYTVDEQERVLEFQFGSAKNELETAGIHWYAPIIETTERVNVTQVQSHQHQALMLTKDENIVDVSLTVQWVIDDAQAYLVNVREPKKSLSQATESALRHVAGSSTMDQVITDGREAIAIEVEERLQRYLRQYGTGIEVTKVNIDRSAPPVQVQDAFNDVQKAKEDRQRYMNQATAYAQQVVPEARGRAQKQIEEAQGYRDQVIARSDGEAQRFEKLLAEYARAPKVTRDRLYLEALEKVFRNSSKVMVDVEGGNNMMYLPLDKLAQRGQDESISPDAIRAAADEIRRELLSSNRGGSNRSRNN